MFGFLVSSHRKTRRLAADWLELADRVSHYRRDVLPEAELAALGQAAGQLRQLLREKADPARLKLGIDGLEGVLRRTGGAHYPKSGLVENVEFFLVAAIVILGLRAFYIQPFKIPTNSMWPSYHGMTAQVYTSPESEPSKLELAFGLLTRGASPRRVDAPAEGEVWLRVAGSSAGIAYNEVSGRSWGVLPTRLREYRLFVGDPATGSLQAAEPVRVPLDFDMDWALRDAFFPQDERRLDAIVAEKLARGEGAAAQIKTSQGAQAVRFVRTGKRVRAGERLLAFDILTGDQLFVDRVSYHFIRPQVGSGFVFRTRNIPDLARHGGDQYYIKRLVGGPGDVLELTPPVLRRNGAPIDGAEAFTANNQALAPYAGYVFGQLDPRYPNPILQAGESFRVPPGEYLPLGDNSRNSLDGRYWGTVPARDMVGRPLFIYYPFTRRWGPAQ